MAHFGYAVSESTRAGSYWPSLAKEESIEVFRRSIFKHLKGLLSCGCLVVAVPGGRRTRYKLADVLLVHAMKDRIG
ncbi:transcriptional regulator [Arthrobacter sp. B2a2-09]|nr:transcriptional regulator [Arthrobacter sp. B2a2-09]MCZ9882325.1 transcriptional regulator [Arthrobacter sp. B2a2-09]